ncbi:MAG: PAS domain-containing protein [Proteobacteria bacterium]|nr:PAS domain-containing protein [Pseudomonadota bacterium]
MARKEVKTFIPFVEALAQTFGKNCEVVLHDFSKPNQSIIKISNGHVTEREVGGPPTGLILSLVEERTKDDFIVGYRTKSRRGAEIKSTTIFIRDKKRKILGALCINLDITPYIAATNTLEDLCCMPEADGRKKVKEVSERFEPTVESLIGSLLEQSIQRIGKPVMHMRKKEKLAIVKDLKKNGLFSIRGAAKKISQNLGVSLPTIYKYLEEAK